MQFLSQLPKSIFLENLVEAVPVIVPGKCCTDAFAREPIKTADAKFLELK
jgi:hypothetical protein